MAFTSLTQASEAPFSMSDYINFDYDSEASNQTLDVTSRDSVPIWTQNTSIESPHVGFTDAFDTGFTGSLELLYGNAVEMDVLPDDLPILEPTASSRATNRAVLETPLSNVRWVPIPMEVRPDRQLAPSPRLVQEPPRSVPLDVENQREPSRWTLASPQLQRHLNAMYAPQLSRLSADPNPPPALFLPAEDNLAMSVPNIQSLPNDHHTRKESPQTYQMDANTCSIDPSLLMQSKGEVGLLQPLPSGTFPLTSPIADADVPDDEDSKRKRAVDAIDFESEAAAKQNNSTQAKPSAVVAEDNKCGEESLPPTPDYDRVHEEIDNQQDADADDFSSHSPVLSSGTVSQEDNTGALSSFTVPKKGPNWQYEQTKEIRLRHQRQKEWTRCRMHPYTTGKSRNRKMQKMLEEIEDTKEFAEAQGFESRETMRTGRPARKGAKKSYVGQG